MGSSSLGKIIDSSIKDLDSIVKKESLNLTTLLNIKKLLEMEYQRVVFFKNELLKELNKEGVKKVDIEKTINDLYVILQRIEDKATFFAVLMKEKSSLIQ